MKKHMLLGWILSICLCACATAETTENPTATLLETVRKDCGWMKTGDALYRSPRLYCSLLDEAPADEAAFSTEESYFETIGFGEDTIVVFGTFATTHSVEAFMDSEFMPDGDIERPEDYAEIAGESCNQYRFTTRFADAEFDVDAFSFSADETIFLFLTARRSGTDAARDSARLDDWIQTMEILPAES